MKYKVNEYPDGTSYISGPLLDNVNFRINGYADLWKLSQFVDAFHSEHRQRPRITIPNLIDAQADRRFNLGESFGLKLVLKFLAGLDADFYIFHPHNPEVVSMGMELLGNPVAVSDNGYFIESVIKRLEWKTTVENGLRKDLNCFLMSTDAGGFKPLMKMADTIQWRGETESASKSRKYVDGKTKLIQKIDRHDFEGKDILLVDDICVYGGTFKGLAKMLRERNCGKLYLAVSHMTVENLGEDPVTNYFDKVFTTNSKGFEYYAEGTGHDKAFGIKPKNLEIVNLFS